MRNKLLIPFIVLVLYFTGSYDELSVFWTVLEYEWHAHPEVQVELFKGNRDDNLRKLISNIKRRKSTIKERSLSPNYEIFRNSILDKVR